MLVERSNFEAAFLQLLSECKAEKFVGYDTETTALYWWKSPHYAIEPRVFSMQFATANTDYYFDFGAQWSTDPLGAEHFERFKELFALTDLVWFIQNAKFDMHHSANHGLEIAGELWCTRALARVINNEEKDCSLDGLSEKYLGANKIDLSEYWKPDGGRVTKIKRPGENGNFYDFLHFDRLPKDISIQYGERDTRLVYKLGLFQRAKIEELNQKFFGAVPSNFGGSLWKVVENEQQLTRTLFQMERRGVQLDMAFVKDALAAAYKGIKDALAVIDPLAAPYVAAYNDTCDKETVKLSVMDWNSHIHLKGLFDQLGLAYTYTEEENASFTKDNLEKLDSTLAKGVLQYRRHSKRAHTYLENYVWLSDCNGVLHCNFAQGGPRTGRMSCREPNLQNVPKRADKKEVDFVLRKCFVPRKGFVLISLDYDQVEYRLMLDYAREMALIRLILEEGLDVHDATLRMLAAWLNDRDEAKTLNFMLLYGGGVPKLAVALFGKEISVSLEVLKAIWMLHKWPAWRRPEYDADKALRASIDPREVVRYVEILKRADALLQKYFETLPAVKDFVAKVKDKAKRSGWVNTWLGRVLQYGKDAKGRTTDYKAPNGLIQGGAGDLSKVAANRCQARLAGTSSFLILHVHDELVGEVHLSELALIPELTQIMETCYPHRLIPLTAGAAWSKKSWGELQDGLPLVDGEQGS